MKKYFVVLSVALVLGLLAGMLAFSTVSADPIPGTRIQLPVIQVDDGWETWIHIFNKGARQLDTGVIVFFWDEYTGLCPSNSPGPSEHVCMKVSWNGVWTLKDHIPAGVKSGMVFSVDEDTFEAACDTAGDYDHLKDWVKKYYTTATEGEQLAVVVDREGLNAFDTVVSSAYTAISEEMEGDGDPAYRYFAPYMMKGYHDLDTIMYIQNSGDECTSLWIQYQQQGICAFTYSQHIQQLAPGETYSTTVPAELPCDWLGSAYIEASQPLGIVVDQTSLPDACDSTDRGMLLSWRGQPYQPAELEGVLNEDLDAWEWDTMLYGDLVFREWSGWSSSVQVQNLTKISQPTFVVVQFFDNSGDVIDTLAEWICPGGSETFYLPVVTDLGFDYWGAVEIESYKQINWPGDVHDGAPIFAIIDLKNATTGQGGAYNAHPRFEKENVWDFALPLLAKNQDVTSLIAIRNNSNCVKINPEIKFKNQEGRIVCIIGNIWLHPKHSTLLDLAKIGCLTDGWVGAAEVIVQSEVEYVCGDETNPVMPSAVVVNRGTGLGDTTRVYEGFPVKKWCIPQQCWVTLTGQVVSEEDGGLPDAAVTVSTDLWCGAKWTNTETTVATGAYTITVPGAPDAVGEDYTITAVKSGYLMVDEDGITEPVTDCDGSTIADDLFMAEENTVGGVVFMEVLTFDTAIEGATVELWKPGATEKWKSTVTGAQGLYSFGGLRKGIEYTLKAKKDALSGTGTYTPSGWGENKKLNIEL